MATEAKELDQVTHSAPIGEHHDREAWLEWRRGHVGASEVAALFGLHPFLNKRELYFRKIGPYEEDEEPNRAMRRGSALEHIAVEEFEKETGRQTRRVPARRHPELEVLGSSLDRQILAGPDHEGTEHPTEGLEVKVPGYQTFAAIKEQGLRDYMTIQGQVEAMVYGYPRTVFAVLHADSFELLTFPIEADPSIEASILGEVEAFWKDHVIPGIPPDEFEGVPDIDIPESRGELVYVDDAHLQDLMERVATAKQIRDEARDTYKALRKELQEELQDEPAKYRARDGEVEVNLYWNKGRTRFQKKELKAVQPLDPEKVREVLLEMEYGAVQEFLEVTRLDLTAFERASKPYPSMRIKRVEPEEF